MAAFAEELVDEAFGASSRRWALVVAALGVGAAAALLLTARSRPAEDAAPRAPESTDPSGGGRAVLDRTTATVESAWKKVSAPPAVLRRLPSPGGLVDSITARWRGNAAATGEASVGDSPHA